jgi:glycosyltransferase involved in cell wall biosynthesis
MKDLSVVIPAYNEQKNVRLLYNKLKEVLTSMKISYEIIYIDDGSTDKTYIELEGLQKKDQNITVIKFRGNFGQTFALDAGFKAAQGKVIISMDADLQNDPADIPILLAKMKEGYDVVSGWRRNRKDPMLKRIISRGAYLLRKILFKDEIHDSGCTLKAFKRECFDDLDLFGEMHRFIPAMLSWQGFKVAEVVVAHHKRKYGKTKYTIKRVVKGFLDMVVVKFWMGYSSRPIYLFGGFGLLMVIVGLIIGVYLSIQKLLAYDTYTLSNRPLLLLSILLIILGVQFVVSGLLADIVIKTYYKKRKPYKIEKELKWKN